MNRRLSDEEAMQIVCDPRRDMKQIARDWGVSLSLVQQLRNGRLRPHLLDAYKATLPRDTAEWRPIPDWPLYEISDDARIRNAVTKRLVRQRPNEHGYPIVDLHQGKRYGLSEEAKQVTRLVHVLVCRVFNGEPPSDKHEVAHNDGNPANPLPSNLRWATRRENFADKLIHGTNNHGVINGGAKITEEQARQILADPRSSYELGKKKTYGICSAQIDRIRSGKKWKHLHETA